jgi:hypothetical protein
MRLDSGKKGPQGRKKERNGKGSREKGRKCVCK